MSASRKSSFRRRSSLLLVLAALYIILMNSRSRNRNLASHSPRMAVQTDGHPVLPGNESIELPITGYWKEVRASLALPPLRDAVLLPSASGPLTGDADVIGGSVQSGDMDEWNLLRLGRLNPGLRRRRIDSDPGSPSAANQPRYGDSNSNFAHLDSFGKLRPERSRDHDLVVGSDTPRTRESSFAPCMSPDCPDLFISSGAPSAPRTPVGALATSFRAIAEKELKAHRGSRHLKRNKLFG